MQVTPEVWSESIPITVPGTLSRQLERILAGERASFALMVPGYAPRVEPCAFCGRLTQLVVLESGQEFNATVSVDEDKMLWVNVADPHSRWLRKSPGVASMKP